MTVRLIVCTTCRFSSEEPLDPAGLSGGQSLLNAVTIAVKAAGASAAFRIEAQACLWACSSHCTVYLTEPGKPSYLAGRFAPTPQDAEAITAFARLYAESREGAVPYRNWPDGMKGHFIARLPPTAS